MIKRLLDNLKVEAKGKETKYEFEVKGLVKDRQKENRLAATKREIERVDLYL